MRQAKFIILLVFISTTLISCTNNTHMDSSNNSSDSAMDASENVPAESMEVSNMRVEVCQIQSIEDESFTLKNTEDEIYRIDNSYLADFREGDWVYLTYLGRTPLGNGEYSADVHIIELITLLRVEDIEIPI